MQPDRTLRRTSNTRLYIMTVEIAIILALYLRKLLWQGGDKAPICIQTNAFYGTVYMIRVFVMVTWLLPRELDIVEIAGTPLMVGLIFYSFSYSAVNLTSDLFS